MTAAHTRYRTLTVVLFLLGFSAAVAFRAHLTESAPETAGVDRHAELVALVEELERERVDLQHEVGDLRRQAADLETQEAARTGVERSYTAEFDRLTMLAGMRAVQGPGVEVTLADNPDPPDDQGAAADYIIHDYDLRTVVNALWDGGAEAVAINGQRLVHSSAVRCVGATVLVNSARVGSPFSVRAIGDPDRLKAALETDAETDMLLTTYAERYGLQVDVDDRDELELPAYSGFLAPRDLRLQPGPTGAGLGSSDAAQTGSG